MRDTIAHSPHRAAAALAGSLAVRLELRREPCDSGRSAGAALLVAPSSAHHHRDPSIPVVVLPRAARRRAELRGRCVLCGVQDGADEAAVAIADALADALELALILVHVVPPVRLAVPGPVAAPMVYGLTIEDRARARETLDRVAGAAGVAGLSPGALRVPRGAPGPTLAAMARAEDAAVVTVSTSIRPRLTSALLGSATGYLTRRCQRPVLVCPRDPLAAMRLREALDWSPAWPRPRR